MTKKDNKSFNYRGMKSCIKDLMIISMNVDAINEIIQKDRNFLMD